MSSRACASILSLSLAGLPVWQAPAAAGPLLDFHRNADRWEVRGGLLSFDTGVFTRHDYWDVVFNGEILAPLGPAARYLGSPRLKLGAHLTPRPDYADLIYAGLNWDIYVSRRVYFSIGFGASYQANSDPLTNGSARRLGCTLNFHEELAVGMDFGKHFTAQLYADHTSNAGSCGHNRGLENAGLRFGYRF